MSTYSEEYRSDSEEYKPDSEEYELDSEEYEPDSEEYKLDSEEYELDSEEYKPDVSDVRLTFAAYRTKNNQKHGKKSQKIWKNGDEGSTVYFCIRLENSKGEAGPWGELFKAIVP